MDRTLLLKLLDGCDRCEGSGAEPGTQPQTCTTCAGAGEVRRAQRSFFGQFVSVAPCPTCAGEGTQAERSPEIRPAPHQLRFHGPGVNSRSAGDTVEMEFRLSSAEPDARVRQAAAAAGYPRAEHVLAVLALDEEGFNDRAAEMVKREREEAGTYHAPIGDHSGRRTVSTIRR